MTTRPGGRAPRQQSELPRSRTIGAAIPAVGGGPPARGRLLERRDELSRVLEVMDRAAPRPAHVAAIEGGWGSGKTTLLREVCLQAGARGFAVAAAWGSRRAGTTSRGALVEAFGPLLSAPPNGHRMAGALQRAANLLRDPSSDPAELAAALVTAVSADARLLLAVDDSESADPESLSVMDAVARIAPERVRLVLAGSPHRPGTVVRTVDWLLAAPECRVVPLAPFDRDTVSRIASRRLGVGPVDDTPRVAWDLSKGHPLVLFEVLEVLRRRGPRAAAEELLSPALASAVLTKLAPISADAGVLAEALAILGEGTSLGPAAALAGLDGEASARAADELIQADILGPGWPLRFGAPLVGTAVLQQCSPMRRNRLHIRAAGILAERGADRREVNAQMLLARPAQDPGAARIAWQCARQALDAGDIVSALACLRRAIEEPPAPDDFPSVLLDLVAAEAEMDRPEAVEHYAQLLRRQPTEPADRRRVAALGVRILRRWGVDGHVGRSLRAAVTELIGELEARAGGGAAEEALALRLRLAAAVAWSECDEETLSALDRAANREGRLAPIVAREARLLVAQERLRTGGCSTVDATIAPLLAQLDLTASTDDPAGRRVGLGAALALVRCGRLGPDAFAVSEDPGPHEATAEILALRAHAHLLRGELGAAVAAARTAGTRPEVTDSRWAATLAAATMVEALRAAGSVADPPALEMTLPRAEKETGAGLLEVFPCLACLELRASLAGEAGQLRRGLGLALSAGRVAARNNIDNPVLTEWRAVAGWHHLQLGDRGEGVGLLNEHLDLVRAFAEPRSLVRALRALAAASPDQERVALLDEAVATSEGTDDRMERARARVQLGEALVQIGDRVAARRHFRAAAQEASECGASRLAEGALGQLRAAGGRPRRLAVTGWESLSPAEARVAVLAAAGRSNRGVARELYISEKTVEGHLRRVYRKLGVPGRTQLAVHVPPDVQVPPPDLKNPA